MVGTVAIIRLTVVWLNGSGVTQSLDKWIFRFIGDGAGRISSYGDKQNRPVFQVDERGGN